MRSRCVQDDRGAAVVRPDQAIREASVVAPGRTAFTNGRYDGYRIARTRRRVFHAKKRNAGVQKGDHCIAGSTDDSARVADHDASVATEAAAVRSKCSAGPPLRGQGRRSGTRSMRPFERRRGECSRVSARRRKGLGRRVCHYTASDPRLSQRRNARPGCSAHHDRADECKNLLPTMG